MTYNVLGHNMTTEEYIAYQEKRIAGLEEELAKAMDVVRVAGEVTAPEGYLYCACCDFAAQPPNRQIVHAEDCPILWLRRHGLK